MPIPKELISESIPKEQDPGVCHDICKTEGAPLWCKCVANGAAPACRRRPSPRLVRGPLSVTRKPSRQQRLALRPCAVGSLLLIEASLSRDQHG